MSIVCGTDFSANSRDAIRAAREFARRGNQPIHLVHVADLFGAENLPKNELELVLAPLQKELEALAEEFGEGITITPKLLLGPADEQLVKYASGIGAQLLIVSSLGRRSAGKWLLGSVAERCVQNSTVPVLVVRHAEPFARWGAGDPLKVMVAYQRSATADYAASWTRDLARLGDMELLAGHVFWPPEERRRLGLTSPVDLEAPDPEMERLIERGLRGHLDDAAGPEVPLKLRMGYGPPPIHFANLARENDVGLAVLGVHQRRKLSRLWHGSFAEGVLRNGDTNVLCVPRPERVGGAQVAPVQVRTIAAATDFSDLGNRAVAYALAMARPGAQVVLIHVSPKPDTDGALEAKLEALASGQVPKDVTLSTVVEVASGHHATAICQAAERSGADVLCMGTRGTSLINRLLLGSVAAAVLTESKLPVMLVREADL